jgi:hypothetical protein
LAAWRGGDDASLAAVVAGAVLTGWIVAQVSVIGLRSPLQPLMGAAGSRSSDLVGGWREPTPAEAMGRGVERGRADRRW